MSAEQTWNRMGDTQDNDLAALLQKGRLTGYTSQAPLVKIKKRLLQNSILSVLICLPYAAIIILTPAWQIQAATGVVLLFSLWGGCTAWKQYRSIVTGVSASNTLLAELKRHYDSIKKWMHIQQRAALYIYPVAAAGGFMLGGVQSSGKTVEQLLSKPVVLIALPVTCIVLAIAGYYLARWLFRLSFGKHMDALRQHINELENEQ